MTSHDLPLTSHDPPLNSHNLPLTHQDLSRPFETVWNTQTYMSGRMDWMDPWTNWQLEHRLGGAKKRKAIQNILRKVRKVRWQIRKAKRKRGKFEEKWGKLWGGTNTAMRKCYISDNFPHFWITFLAVLLLCCQCFHRTALHVNSTSRGWSSWKTTSKLKGHVAWVPKGTFKSQSQKKN